MDNFTSDSELLSENSLDSSSSDSDLEIIVRRRKIYRKRMNNFDHWSDYEFFHRFRLSKAAVIELVEYIRQDIESPTNRGGAIKASTKVLLTLRYYATGNMLLSISDFVGVSVASGSRIVKLVSRVIASLRRDFIKMPESQEELNKAAQELHEISRFPRCCGAIDCTHVRIMSPGGEEAEIYRNRKGYFSLNIQTVSDGQLKIRNIVARWPVSCHDQTIFNNSRLKYNFENGHFRSFHLIGDSGYSLKRYLLTPLQTVNNEPENLYNEALIRTRNVVERQYGVWKRRFPILSQGIKVDIDTAMAIIVATAVLHNMAVEMNEDLHDQIENEVVEGDLQNMDNENVYAEEILGHIQYRTIFINENFH